VSVEPRDAALARLYDLDLAEDPGDLDLYLALAERTGDPIVELAVGTGRVAIPLAAAGHHVVGVDADAAMLDRAQARAAAAGQGSARLTERLRLVRHDMVAVHRADLGPSLADGAGLAILALNSILLLADRARQRAVIATMGSLLAPGGIAAIDVWLPQIDDLARFDGRLSLEWLRIDDETGREVIKQAAAWYDEQVSGLGERFLGEAEAAFMRIDGKPLTGSPWNQRRLPDGVSDAVAATSVTSPNYLATKSGA